ncbi:MAG TPA: hypothetical protein VHC94_03030 [Nitrobacter sp.]|jgi:hypothetical protein|nr:hypothetical protein [Nitrobacter sp.]
MTGKPTQHPSDIQTARRNRLRAALRENLKRRKSQSRARADQGIAMGEDDPLSRETEDEA